MLRCITFNTRVIFMLHMSDAKIFNISFSTLSHIAYKCIFHSEALLHKNPFCAITAYCTKLFCAITALIAQNLFCPISLPLEEALLHKTLCLRTLLDGVSGCWKCIKCLLIVLK